MEKCPVCRSFLEVKEHHDADIHMNVEEYEYCKKCSYDFEFAYGHYKIELNGKTFTWYYNTNKKELKKMYKEINKEARKVQKKLRRLHKIKGRCKILL